jgi:hypothetical protein
MYWFSFIGTIKLTFQEIRLAGRNIGIRELAMAHEGEVQALVASLDERVRHFQGQASHHQEGLCV